MKTALVIGASGTIGYGVALALMEHGYQVACHCHRESAALVLQEKLSPLPYSYAILRHDCTKGQEVAALFQEIRERLGTPEVVVNCMGVALPQMLLTDVTEEQMEHIWSVNVKSALLISQQAADVLRAHESGSLIHISSLWGQIGGSCEVVYSASKGAINAMVKALAKELAPSHIRVNAIAPGLVLSPMNSALPQEDLDAFKADTPLNNFVTPEDVAQAVLYLIHSPMVTGQILAVDGGIVI